MGKSSIVVASDHLYLNGHVVQIFQIARGLAYLHEENIVHGDLRCVCTVSTSRADQDLMLRMTAEHSGGQ